MNSASHVPRPTHIGILPRPATDSQIAVSFYVRVPPEKVFSRNSYPPGEHVYIHRLLMFCMKVYVHVRYLPKTGKSSVPQTSN